MTLLDTLDVDKALLAEVTDWDVAMWDYLQARSSSCVKVASAVSE